LNDVGLSGDVLIDALWLVHDHLRGSTIADVIRLVDQPKLRACLDAAQTKRLYTQLFSALKAHPADLPPDPWSLMVARRPLRQQAKPAAATGIVQGSSPQPPISNGGQLWEFVDIS
jgi:hypothetical protein